MDTKKNTILVVDDSITNIVLLNAVLTEEGYLTRSAFNASDALKMITKDIPGLILLDLQMPVITGLDFLKAIKPQKRFANIPIIIVTAYADKNNISMAQELGVNDIIQKPIDIDILKKKIKQFIN